MSLLQNLYKRLRDIFQAKPEALPWPIPASKGIPPTIQVATSEGAQHSELVAVDEGLLERTRMQWQLADWESLVHIGRETLHQHPERAKLALYAAAGHQQRGNLEAARELTRLAQEWGCSRKLLTRVLIAGVHDTLGRAAAASGQMQRATSHIATALEVGTPGIATPALTQVRVSEQLSQIGLLEHPTPAPTQLSSQTPHLPLRQPS